MAILAALSSRGDAARASRVRQAITKHRTSLGTLFDERRQHAIELRDAGWQFGPIGELYGLTPERVRQLVSTTMTPADEAVA
jgi:hypothetical protein